MIVYVVIEQTGETGEEAGYVHGVYSSLLAAEAAAEAVRAEWRKDGLTLYEDSGDNGTYWDRCAVIEAHEVQS